MLRTNVFAFFLCSLLGAACPPAHALTEETRIDDVAVTVFAPDWTWQNRDVNILLVLENDASAPRDVSVSLVLPPGNEDDFEIPEGAEVTRTVKLNPDDTVRQAFTKITARPGPKLQTYEFAIDVSVNGEQATVLYPLQTIRGAVSRGAVWVALLVPCGVALMWCIAFALALKHFARPGAWKAPSEALKEPEHKEPWIDQNATS